jgi:hypothetical protein
MAELQTSLEQIAQQLQVYLDTNTAPPVTWGMSVKDRSQHSIAVNRLAAAGKALRELETTAEAELLFYSETQGLEMR